MKTSIGSYLVVGIIGIGIHLFGIPVLNYGINSIIGNNTIYEKEMDHFEIEDLFSNEEVEELREYVFQHDRFLTGKEAFAAGVEELGEAVQPDENGNCPSELYSTGNGKCVIPGRYDIGRHYFLTGGSTGAKETFEKLTSSIYAFYRVLPIEFIKSNKMFQNMFAKQEYQSAMSNLCTAQQNGNFYFRPLQVNIVVVTPGQDLPLHYDNGWFWGANRFTMPDYLTVAMTTSGLFKSIEIPQAQSVVYLHGTKEEKDFKHGGEYIFYPNGPGGGAKTIPIKRGHGVIMNGGKIVHGGRRINEEYKAKNFGSKDSFQRLEYQGNGTWYLLSNQHIIDHFKTEDLRISFVWRGLCFKSEQEANSYESYPSLDLELILLKFENDLRRRGVLKGQRPEPKHFNQMIINEYIKMPTYNVHNSFNFNYCIISKKYPKLKSIFSPFCTDVDPFQPLNDILPKPKPICHGRQFTSPQECP